MLRTVFISVALVGGSAGELLLHAASLQESMTALGLSIVPGELAAPEFRLPDLEGTPVNSQDYRGKVVMLYFWTTW